MKTAEKRNKLLLFIDTAEDKIVKALYTILEERIEGQQEITTDHWQDNAFVEEMNRRYNDYKNGITQLISSEEVETKATQAAKKNKKQVSKT